MLSSLLPWGALATCRATGFWLIAWISSRAFCAGLDLVDEGAALILDADGQDPPELVPQFVARWREGHDNIYGTRMARDGEAWIKRATAAASARGKEGCSIMRHYVSEGHAKRLARMIEGVAR